MARAIETADLCRLRWLETPRLAPDGAAVAYVEGGLDRARDATTSRVWVAPLNGGSPRCLTPDGARDEAPRWSPVGGAGRRPLALVSDRAGARQLWVADSRDGAVRRVCDLNGVASPAWSPDGTRLAFVAPDDAPGRVHLWTVSSDSGTPTRLAALDRDAADPAWSPDGRWIAFRAARDLWVVPAASGEPRRLTVGAGPVRALAWSPDGGALAFIGHDRGDDPAANGGVWLAPLAGGPPCPLTAALDRSAGLTVRADTPEGLGTPDLAWLSVGGAERIYFCHADRGRSWLGWVTPRGEPGIAVGGERAVLAFDAAARADRLAFVAADGARPGELRLADLDGRGERTIVAPNADWLAEVAVSTPEFRPFRADDGELIDAWLVRPPIAADAGPPPLILNIHGGPHYPLGERFYFEFQRLAARGYAVLYANPRGSQGYGAAFAAAIRGAWGDRDARDLLAALDAALADGAGDPTRLGVTGVSYGGYLTQWLIAHDPPAGPPRFAAAVSENGIAELALVYEANPAFWAWELHGTPQTHPQRYRDRSPVAHADRVRTPLLLIHAEEDATCPIAQSEVAYAALVARGQPTALARIPGEGHLMNLIGRPSSRLLRAAHLDEWFDGYLRPAKLVREG